MALNSNRLSILIVGATGKLGSLITKHALNKPELLVNILVRDPTKNQELTDAVEKSGGEVFKGDVTQPETLDEATKNIHTVVFAASSTDEKIVVDGQLDLLNTSIKNGVKRFVPGDFGVNYTRFSHEELSRTSIVFPKIKFEEKLKEAHITFLRFHQGILIETFLQLQGAEGQGFGYWGEDFKLDLTCYDDLARAVVAGVSRPDLKGKVVFTGESLSYKEIAEVYNKVRGTNIQAKKKGSVEDLKKLYEEKRRAGEFLADLLGLTLIISDKRCQFEKNNNSELPEVKTTSFGEFLEQNPDIKPSFFEDFINENPVLQLS